ncbi:hypothetical protein X805_13580 [Sphaerotilus natans subsp. natans DSM 6575]|uniref:Uncharacterized protein n=1 Tax=Sphaerotilus natans subsp. natans DSM 6575 TaxID=1286631 RepID=A0A059KNG8_9BURK|nr:hypothetical protein X805_13580 [Sphaerotilus natans subsp. natans DSM 6575]
MSPRGMEQERTTWGRPGPRRCSAGTGLERSAPIDRRNDRCWCMRRLIRMQPVHVLHCTHRPGFSIGARKKVQICTFLH